MSDIKTLLIADREYKMVVMSPWTGAAYAARVVGLLTKALAGEASEAADLAEAKGDIATGGLTDDKIKKIMSMVMRVLPHLDADTFTELAREAFSNSSVSVRGQEIYESGLFDEHFNKHRGDYFAVAIWAIKENCTGFFVGGGPAWSALGGLFNLSKSPAS